MSHKCSDCFGITCGSQYGIVLSGALPNDYLSTEELEPSGIEVPVETPAESSPPAAEEESGEGEPVEPNIGQITFVSCVAGSGDANSLPPLNSDQDSINTGKYNSWSSVKIDRRRFARCCHITNNNISFNLYYCIRMQINETHHAETLSDVGN